VVGLIVVWSIAAVVGAMLVIAVAWRRGRSPAARFAFAAGHLLGWFLVGAAILAWLLDGYVEDFGMPPVESAARAVVFAASGTPLLVVVWALALRRPRHRPHRDGSSTSQSIAEWSESPRSRTPWT
jgi:ABC-type amino acid transport system permease subunit